MITTYLLPAIYDDVDLTVLGESHIHDALLEATEVPLVYRLIQDTTPEEHEFFVELAVESRLSTPEEVQLFNDFVVYLVIDPDITRAQELLSNSPDVITQPELWELVRIFGKRLGYLF